MTTRKKRFGKIAVCIGTGVSLLLPLVVPAEAGVPDMGIFSNAVEVSDEELAGMEGKFVDGNQIVSFGVEMTTRWLTSAGDVLQEGLSMVIDLDQSSAPQFSPVLTIYRTDAGAQPLGNIAVATGASVNASGLDNITGVAQSIQVAGDANSIVNDVRIDITSETDSTLDGLAGKGSGTPVPMTAGSRSFQGANGASSSYTVNGGVIGLEITLPDGKVIQQIRGGQGLFQSVQLANSMNRVENHFNLTVGIRPTIGNSSSNNFTNTLQAMRGLPQIGTF